MAQKAAEEGLELALAGAGGTEAEIVAEAADLRYRLLVLLKVCGLSLEPGGRRTAFAPRGSRASRPTGLLASG